VGSTQVHLADPVLFAIPVFILFMVVEAVAIHVLRHDDGVIGYEARDTRTSIVMGLGYLVVNALWRLVMLVVFAAIYEMSPLKLDPHQAWVWVLLFFTDDLLFYVYHRVSHRVRLFWAAHVSHHSSQYFNFSTAVRQKWVPLLALWFWVPEAALGIPPWMMFTAMSWNLVYQFFLHTESIGTLPRWFEFVFNTPSHHRVHHGSDEEYIDRNYGGILIIWDRMFRSFVPETHRPTYGLTKNIDTYNPVRVAFHEFVDIWRDVRSARSVRDAFGYMFGPPGWRPAEGGAPAAPVIASKGLAAEGDAAS
jgi:sterol desaturase/sphingolipid hydroxylase (fatty acid hydroxylase superfamily)